MKKKLLAICGVFLAAVLLIAGYNAFLAPNAQEGEKSVTIEVIIGAQGIEESFSYRTNQAYLEGLLAEHQDQLQVKTEDSSFGPFLSGILGIDADASKEFFLIQVDGEDASVGIASLPVEDGKTYSFILTEF